MKRHIIFSATLISVIFICAMATYGATDSRRDQHRVRTICVEGYAFAYDPPYLAQIWEWHNGPMITATARPMLCK